MNGQDVRLLRYVSEGKVVKNRVHVCLQPADRDRDREVERVLALGATMLADHRTPDGDGWAVLCDPAGNEFCMTRSSSERHS
ncbi:VOC family protein [Micromonospora cremea]|uniref:VOC family protein n=1 Tax=Micromonospora cremea TaxID=709881 RepID=UPI000A56755C